MDKPLPCPFCGSDNIRMRGDRLDRWREVCFDCGANGPAASEEEATTAWNRRAPWTVTQERGELIFGRSAEFAAKLEALGGKVEG